MIKINLLPSGSRPAAFSMPILALPWKGLWIASLSLMVFYSIGLLWGNDLQARRLALLTAQWRELQPQWAQLQQTQAVLQAWRNRASVIKTLKQPEAQWAPRLNLLSDAIVSGLWFRVLRFGESTAGEGNPAKPAAPAPAKTGKERAAPPDNPRVSLMLDGSAFVASRGEGDPVRRYLERLKQHPEFSRWFKGLELKSMEQRQIDQEQISDFMINLYPTGS